MEDELTPENMGYMGWALSWFASGIHRNIEGRNSGTPPVLPPWVVAGDVAVVAEAEQVADFPLLLLLLLLPPPPLLLLLLELSAQPEARPDWG